MNRDERTYHFKCGNASLSQSVVEAVGFATGRDPMDLEPLADAVDPEALESLFTQTETGSITFAMEGVDVTVTSDDEILVDAGRERGSIHDHLDDESTVLLVDQPLDPRSEAACVDLSSPTPSEEANLLAVTFTPSARDRVETWSDHASDCPANAAVVDVQTATRSAASQSSRPDSARSSPDPSSPAASSSSGPSRPPGSGADGSEVAPAAIDSVSVQRIEDATDLTSLGIEISEQIAEWEGNGNRTAVCFHSVTDLLLHVDEVVAFRFLHVLADRFAAADVVAHYHMDAGAHDETTIGTFRPLFDAVVEADEHGDWVVQNERASGAGPEDGSGRTGDSSGTGAGGNSGTGTGGSSGAGAE